MKNSKEWLAKEQELKKEALILMMRSNMLRQEADKNFKNIEKFQKEYPDNVLEELPWDEKETVMEKTDELADRLKANAKWLRIIEKEYEILRTKVNAFYGSEVMKANELLPDFPGLELDEDDDDTKSGDWWKHCDD